MTSFSIHPHHITYENLDENSKTSMNLIIFLIEGRRVGSNTSRSYPKFIVQISPRRRTYYPVISWFYSASPGYTCLIKYSDLLDSIVVKFSRIQVLTLRARHQ
jgi:hypothetical protein